MELLRVRIEQRDASTIVEVSGELDIGTRPQLQETIDDVLRRGARQLVVDLRPLEFLDSAGIGLLFALSKKASEDGFDLVVVRSEMAQRLLAITGVDSQLTIVDRIDDLPPIRQ